MAEFLVAVEFFEEGSHLQKLCGTTKSARFLDKTACELAEEWAAERVADMLCSCFLDPAYGGGAFI